MTGDTTDGKPLLPKEFEQAPAESSGYKCAACGTYVIGKGPHVCYPIPIVNLGPPDYTEVLDRIATALENLCNMVLEGRFSA